MKSNLQKIKTQAIVNQIRKRPCEICGTNKDIRAHHLRSKDKPTDDRPENLIPLCFEHHRKFNELGLNLFVEKFKIDYYLIERNWYKCEISEKWMNNNL